MPSERWGSLSVADHIDAAALTTNILLYDRLVVPVMTEQPDRDERAYWINKGWDPDLQAARLQQMGDLAVRRAWDQSRRAQFKSRAQELAAERSDAANFEMTRMILAREQILNRPAGVGHVTVVAAYNSQDALNKDFPITSSSNNLSAQAYLLSRRLAVPAASNGDTLKEAIKLSSDSSFRTKRAVLFDWQDQAVLKGWTPTESVDRVSEMADEYNKQVKKAFGKVIWRFAFTIGGIALGLATGEGAVAAASAALSLIQFTVLDKKPTIEPGSSEPAAMFHDIETRIGAQLSKPPEG